MAYKLLHHTRSVQTYKVVSLDSLMMSLLKSKHLRQNSMKQTMRTSLLATTRSWRVSRQWTQISKRANNIKDRIDKYLNDSFFTHLAKQQIFVKKEIKNCEVIGQRIDKSLRDGFEFKRQREEKFKKNNDALKKVLEDISSNEVIKLISSSEPCVARMDSRMYDQVNGGNKQQNNTGQQQNSAPQNQNGNS